MPVPSGHSKAPGMFHLRALLFQRAPSGPASCATCVFKCRLVLIKMGQRHFELETGHLSHSFSTGQASLFIFLAFFTPPPLCFPTACGSVTGVMGLAQYGSVRECSAAGGVKAPSASTSSILIPDGVYSVERCCDDYVLASL